MMTFRFVRSGAAVACACLLAACGSGDDGADGRTTLLSLAAEPSGTNCTSGGTRVVAGLDLDSDGTLQGSEATQTAYVCDGQTGASGGTTGATGATGAPVPSARPAPMGWRR